MQCKEFERRKSKYDSIEKGVMQRARRLKKGPCKGRRDVRSSCQEEEGGGGGGVRRRMMEGLVGRWESWIVTSAAAR